MLDIKRTSFRIAFLIIICLSTIFLLHRSQRCILSNWFMKMLQHMLCMVLHMGRVPVREWFKFFAGCFYRLCTSKVCSAHSDIILCRLKCLTLWNLSTHQTHWRGPHCPISSWETQMITWRCTKQKYASVFEFCKLSYISSLKCMK